MLRARYESTYMTSSSCSGIRPILYCETVRPLLACHLLAQQPILLILDHHLYFSCQSSAYIGGRVALHSPCISSALATLAR